MRSSPGLHPLTQSLCVLGLVAPLSLASGCGEGGAGERDGASGGAGTVVTGGVAPTGGASSESGGTGAGMTLGGAVATGGLGVSGAGAETGGAYPSGGSESGGSESGGSESGGVPTTGGTMSGGSESGGVPTTGGTMSGGTSGLEPVTWPQVNGIQWADAAGEPIQAHGGGVLRVGDDYYWFGENRNPDGTFFAVSAYRSRDLRRWEHVRDVLEMTSDPGLNLANVERPKVVYNAATGRYVMWMHWENGRDYGEARAAVASSDEVAGDYTYHGSFRPLQDSGVTDHGKPGYMSRDCTLFVDDDGRGYFLSSANENYDLHLYLLTDDYLSIVRREALLFAGGHREAPALFKRAGTYFLLTSGATGWSPNQARFATSSSLTTGWSELQNVGDANTFYSQPTFVLEVAGTQGTEFLYLGDRWAGAWGGRVNDSAYVWLPIDFSGPTTMGLSWANTVILDAEVGTVEGAVNTFSFVNRRSGLILAVEGVSGENGADLVQQPRDTAVDVAWRFNYDGAGYFRLTHEAGGKVIDVPDESTQAGIALHLWDGNNGDHQAWRLIDLGAGAYRIRNKNSGLYMGVSGASTLPGAAIEQQAPSSGEEQIWELVVVE